MSTHMAFHLLYYKLFLSTWGVISDIYEVGSAQISDSQDLIIILLPVAAKCTSTFSPECSIIK